MPRRSPFPLPLALLAGVIVLANAAARAQRGAVITNAMPPGGEGAGSVALGVAVPSGPASMEVNPALLAWEGARTGSVLQVSTSSSELLPGLFAKSPKDERLTETVRALGLTVPLKPGTNLALGYSWHEIDFGTSTIYDWNGDDVGRTIHSDEQVHHLVAAVRLGGIASVGAGWRWIDSRLAPALLDSNGREIGVGTASTWDVGVLVAPRWRIPRTPIRVGPSVGMSWITVGEDSIDYGTSYKDPVTRLRRWGSALSVKVPDLLAVEGFLDEEIDLSDETRRDALEFRGWSVEAFGLVRWTTADLTDPRGSREETQSSMEYIFDLKQLWRLKARIQGGKFLQDLEDESEGYPLPSVSVLGTTITPNVRLVYTRSEIVSEKIGGVRAGQERFAFALSI